MMTINKMPEGIYIHIPFCVKKCIYCDFNSYSECNAKVVNRYFDALYTEAELLANEYDRNGCTADSVFIGGGTPSSVDACYIERLFSFLPLSKTSEVTVESNPGTLTDDKLKVYRQCGINRLSMGVQSFDDIELDFLGRIHSSAEAVDSFELARKLGFDNINIDLIFGFPGHTIESWKRTLNQALALEPEHISFYSLQIEENTLLYDMFRRDEVEQISDELNREMYHYAVNSLKNAGYNHYEISNAAKPGRECRHNLKYWTMKDYAGLGAGAHSFVSGSRFYNPSGIKEYEVLVSSEKEKEKIFSVRASEKNGSNDDITDFIFTGMRLTRGICLSEFKERYGESFMERYGEIAGEFIEDGYLIMEKDRLFFSEKGLDIANYILKEFM